MKERNGYLFIAEQCAPCVRSSSPPASGLPRQPIPRRPCSVDTWDAASCMRIFREAGPRKGNRFS